jgi:hypothetical protein
MTEIKCPNCGATSGAVMESPGVWRCEFCETQFVVEEPKTPAAAPPKPARAPSPARVEAAPQKKPSAARTTLVVVGSATVMVAVGALFMALGSSTNDDGGASHASAHAGTATAPAAPNLSAEFHFDRMVPSSDGSFYVLGEVKNTSTVPIGSAKVYTLMKDAHGHELASESSYTAEDLIAPGETVPFSGIVSKPPHYAHLAFQVEVSEPVGVGKQAKGLRLVNDRARRGKFGAGWVFSGKVINDGHSPAEFIKVEVVARDADGKILGVDNTFADGKSLAPGASTRYEITTYSYPAHVAPKTFYYRVWGREK